MKKLFPFLIIAVLASSTSYSQVIEGNKLLDLIGKPLTDPLVQQLRSQENFITDAWNRDFTVYINNQSGQVASMDLLNGKLWANGTKRYGYYKRTLPWGLQWSMSENDIRQKLGEPTLVSTKMNFNIYQYSGWKITVDFENGTPVSISFRKAESGTYTAPAANPVANTEAWLIKMDPAAGTAQVNWTMLKNILSSGTDLQKFAGRDSTDYIGQVYYSTPNQVVGFNRTAVKRKKKDNFWYYEAFYKTSADSEQVRKIFFALYDALKTTISANSGNDFILASSAKMPISAKTANWLAQWSLYSKYTTLPAGLPTWRIALQMTGMDNVFKKGQRDYTFKIYLVPGYVEYDFFTWSEP